MISPSSILVDVDALAAEQPALTCARDLAAGCGARLEIVDVLPLVPPNARHFVTADLEQELVDHRTTNGIDLVVMGTVARSGIRGLVMGNTAERVLQRLRGSVLAVKPPGFVSPVEHA
jgi:nucleotide-binding universal stress UspA family protein